MRVLIISTNSDNAGAPKHVEDLALGLRSQCDLLVLFGCNGPVASRLERAAVAVQYVPGLSSAISPITDLKVLLSLLRTIRAFNPDVLHLHSSKAGILGRVAGFLTKKRTIFTIHGWSWNSVSGKKALIFKALEKLLSSFIKTKFIVVSNSTLEQGKLVLGDKLRHASVVYNGVKDIGFNVKCRGDKMQIIMPARVAYPKDHLTLVKALAGVDFEFEVVFCGSGTDEDSFKRQVRELDPNKFCNYKFLGNLEEVAPLLHEANVMVLSSLSEALPLSILEGLSAGLIVVASDVGGVSEAVFPNLNGKLFSAGNPAELREALVSIYNEDLFDRYSRASRRLYEEKFTVTKMLTETVNIYENVSLKK